MSNSGQQLSLHTHQALSVSSGLNLRCSEGIRSSLEVSLKHLPGSSGAFLTFAGTTVALMEFTVQRVDQVDSDHIRFAIFNSHSQDRTGAITDDSSSLLAFYDTLKLLARHIRRCAASVEQVNADFMMNFMDVVPPSLEDGKTDTGTCTSSVTSYFTSSTNSTHSSCQSIS